MQKMPSSALVTHLKSLMARRDRTGVNACVAELVRRDAPLGGQWRTLADVMIHNGEVRLAREAIRRFVAIEGNSNAARFYEAVVLARTGSVEVAHAIVANLPRSFPDPASHAYIMGTIEAALGRWDAAKLRLLEAVAAKPDSGQAWLALVTIGRVERNGEIERCLSAAEAHMDAAPPMEQAQYRFARGKVFDDVGEPEQAFAEFDRGNALMRAERPYSRETDVRSAAEALRGFDRALIDRTAQTIAVPTDRVIFVTGSPRSGSTLVEQILVSHSAISHGEELTRFGILGGELKGFSGAALETAIGDGKSPTALSALYLHLVDQRFGPAGRVVDKTLDASRYLGLVAALLPDAPIVWMRRNRRDTALSCYRTYFFTGLEWSFDLTAIGQHFALEDMLLEQWQRMLGDRLLVVDYEALVSCPETVIPALLAHCGLDPEPQVFTPNLTERVVSTASVAQVREPINTRAVDASAAYAAQLAPFTESYARARKALGLGD